MYIIYNYYNYLYDCIHFYNIFKIDDIIFDLVISIFESWDIY